MKKSKKNYVIIALVIILLASAVGYAAFQSTLNITGTATAQGTWNVHFVTANTTISPDAATKTGNSVSVNTDEDAITATVALGYPGDGATITTQIKNEGTVDAKLTGFTVEGLDGATFTKDENSSTPTKDVYKCGAILVSVPVMDTTGNEVIAKTSGICNFAFDVEWNDANSNATALTSGQTSKFKITFDYEQDTTAFTSGVSHTH